jgi:hypothetical protein
VSIRRARQLDRRVIAFVRWLGGRRINQQISACRQLGCGDVAGGQFEHASRSSGCNANAPGRNPLGEAQNAHLAVQKHHVDAESHAQGVNAAARDQQQAFFFRHPALAQQAHAARLKRTGHSHMARDATAVHGAQFQSLHSASLHRFT